MAKGTYIGSLPEDDPLFSRPLWIGSVIRCGQFAKSSQKNTDGGGDPGDLSADRYGRCKGLPGVNEEYNNLLIMAKSFIRSFSRTPFSTKE